MGELSGCHLKIQTEMTDKNINMLKANAFQLFLRILLNCRPSTEGETSQHAILLKQMSGLSFLYMLFTFAAVA